MNLRIYRSQTAQSVAFFILLAFGLTVWWGFWPAAGYTATPGQPAPEITGGPWINSQPLTVSKLRGRVVLVEFWTYG